MKKLLAIVLCLALGPASATTIIKRGGTSTYAFGFMSRKATTGVLITQNDYTAGSLATGDSDTRSSTATYFNSSNVLSSAAANTARFDYSTGVAQGWLVESASTNFVQESNTFNLSPWLGNNLNYTQNVTGIDGTTSGWTMIPAVASSSQVWEYSTITANSSQNTISLYAKAGTWSYVYLNLENAAGTVWASAVFNVGAAGTVATQTATAGGATIAATSQTLMANGYYRITMTSTVASAVYPLFGYAPAATGNTFGSFGIINASTWAATETLFLTNFQFENTSFPTSYIPTPSTASVTRAADTAANAAWYNGTSGNYLMAETKSESTGVISRASYCNSGCTGTSFSAPTNVWIRRICQFTATTGGATSAIANAAFANGTVCSVIVPYVGPGDIASGATAWYGLRAYNAAYATGSNPAAIIRRASDNTTTTINILSTGAFDTATAATFCASTTCYISTWYDQSGNGHNATQSTNANQPQLAFSYLGSLPCARFNIAGPDEMEATIPTLSIPTSYSFVWDAVTTLNGGGTQSLISTFTTPPQQQVYYTASTQVVLYNGSFFADGHSYSINQNYASSVLFNNTTSEIDTNGTITSGTASTGGTSTTLALGARPGNSYQMDGYMCEAGVWASDVSSSFASLISNQRSYWGF